MPKPSLQDEIIAFYDLWNGDTLCDFLRDTIELFSLYDMDDESDWVADEVGDENVRNVRLVRTVYLMSRIAEKHAGKLARVKSEFKALHKRMEKLAE